MTSICCSHTLSSAEALTQSVWLEAHHHHHHHHHHLPHLDTCGPRIVAEYELQTDRWTQGRWHSDNQRYISIWRLLPGSVAMRQTWIITHWSRGYISVIFILIHHTFTTVLKTLWMWHSQNNNHQCKLYLHTHWLFSKRESGLKTCHLVKK